MNNYDAKTLIPALLSLIVLIANTVGHPLDQMSATQLATDIAALIGTVQGIIANHYKMVKPIAISPTPAPIQTPAPVPIAALEPVPTPQPPVVHPAAPQQPFQGEGI